jgi:hypothetical protein
LLQPAAAARARWMVAREFASRFETVADAADALETIALHGLAPDFYDRMPPLIVSLDAARIRSAVSSLALGHEVVVVSADRAVLPQLVAAGFPMELLAEPAP